jgi:hypothetical protein
MKWDFQIAREIECKARGSKRRACIKGRARWGEGGRSLTPTSTGPPFYTPLTKRDSRCVTTGSGPALRSILISARARLTGQDLWDVLRNHRVRSGSSFNFNLCPGSSHRARPVRCALWEVTLWDLVVEDIPQIRMRLITKSRTWPGGYVVVLHRAPQRRFLWMASPANKPEGTPHQPRIFATTRFTRPMTERRISSCATWRGSTTRNRGSKQHWRCCFIY